jgi:hypothetical protein
VFSLEPVITSVFFVQICYIWMPSMSITLHSWVEWHLNEATSVRTLLVQTRAKLWSLVESYIFDWKLWIPFPLSVMSTSVVHDKRNKCLMLLSLSPNVGEEAGLFASIIHELCFACTRIASIRVNCLARWNNTANSCIPPIPPPPQGTCLHRHVAYPPLE